MKQRGNGLDPMQIGAWCAVKLDKTVEGLVDTAACWRKTVEHTGGNVVSYSTVTE